MNATGGQTEFPQFAGRSPGYGSEWKKAVRAGTWRSRVWNAGAEMLARKENFVELDPEVKDAWGIPVLKIHSLTGTTITSCRRLPAARRGMFRKGGRRSHAEPPPAARQVFPAVPARPTAAGATTAAAGRGGSGRGQAGGEAAVEGERPGGRGRPRRVGVGASAAQSRSRFRTSANVAAAVRPSCPWPALSGDRSPARPAPSS